MTPAAVGTIDRTRRGANAPPGRRSGWSAPFVACATILLASAVLTTVGRHAGWLRVLKLAAPLQRPLDGLPRSLGPLRLTLQPRLPSEMEEELGTREYAVWRGEDASAPESAAWRVFNISITYYTGKADQVPHVPEECLYQGGREQVGEIKSMRMPVKDLQRVGEAAVPVRSLLFRDPGTTRGMRVYYTICCNADYYDNRIAVRLRMADLREKHLYYSKVELGFMVGIDDEPTAELTRAAQRIFEQLLPTLARDFWPDWGKIERSGAVPVPS